MGFDDNDDLRAAGTIIDARDRTSRAAWWWLVAVALVAVLALLREPIAAWLAPRIDALVAGTQAPARERDATASPSASAPRATVPAGEDTRRAPTAWAETPAATDAATPREAPSATPATHAATNDIATASATTATAPLPQVRPLYPVGEAPAAPPGPEGKAGLVEALREGKLRLATGADIARWKSRAAMHGNPPARDFDDHLRMLDAYVIRRDFTMPGGLHGAHAAVFLLEDGVPYPRGDAGHSAVLDLASGACVGASCRSLLQPR
ncbi:MAG TPA: hypothetical protein VM619_08300 [Luteimonas sp.]|nr:hypothetical protein [Luteimonas sp.]